MREFRAELHVHTVLSPCADVEMIPPLIVQHALEHGIDMLAITDHNASANVCAVQKAARGTALTVLPGMEIQSREDVHLLALFDSLESLELWQSAVDQALPNRPNQPDYFGEQFEVDETGQFIRCEPRLLLTSTRFSIDEIFERVSALGGLVIPAHVERASYGLLPTLGLISESWNAPALEISRHTTPEKARKSFPALRSYPLIQNGDVHRLEDFLGATILTLASPTLMEIRLACKQIDGRSICIQDQPSSRNVTAFM